MWLLLLLWLLGLQLWRWMLLLLLPQVLPSELLVR